MSPSSWTDRVSFLSGPTGRFAIRPHEVIVRGSAARAAVAGSPGGMYPEAPVDEDGDGAFRITLPYDVDVLALAADLTDDGYQAEPNYVLFAHGWSPASLTGKPLWGDPLWGDPLWGDPLWGDPLWGDPSGGRAMFGDPLYFDQYQMTGIRPSNARPAPAPSPAPVAWPSKTARQGASILVLDTGLSVPAYLPPYLASLSAAPTDQDSPNAVADPYGSLDPVAGHGTFIAGLIDRLCPGQKLTVGSVLTTEGDTDGWTVAGRLQTCLPSIGADTIINLSLGGYAADLVPGEMAVLARWVRKVQAKGAVVVASAGNDATRRRCYPACLPGVISVGGLGPYGPARFTNYGHWVRACAPAINIVSAFYDGFNGPVSVGPIDPDKFTGWARWSGTSFAAPAVVAALAREMARTNCTALDAVAAVIDGPGGMSIRGLGRVVNIV